MIHNAIKEELNFKINEIEKLVGQANSLIFKLKEGIYESEKFISESGVITKIEQVCPNLVNLRKDRGITQAKLAKYSNIKRSTIGSIEKGSGLSFANVLKILSVYGYGIKFVKINQEDKI